MLEARLVAILPNGDSTLPLSANWEAVYKRRPARVIAVTWSASRYEKREIARLSELSTYT